MDQSKMAREGVVSLLFRRHQDADICIETQALPKHFQANQSGAQWKLLSV
jgi:hypothetical protein